MAAAARRAALTIQVRLDGASIAGLHMGYTFADGENFNSQLVSWNARITEEWHPAEEPAVVRAANPYSVNAQEGFSRTGRRRLRHVEDAE
jgi:hypothetical protein